MKYFSPIPYILLFGVTRSCRCAGGSLARSGRRVGLMLALLWATCLWSADPQPTASATMNLLHERYAQAELTEDFLRQLILQGLYDQELLDAGSANIPRLLLTPTPWPLNAQFRRYMLGLYMQHATVDYQTLIQLYNAAYREAVAVPWRDIGGVRPTSTYSGLRAGLPLGIQMTDIVGYLPTDADLASTGMLRPDVRGELSHRTSERIIGRVCRSVHDICLYNPRFHDLISTLFPPASIK